jgi:hypothetical protein
MKTFLFVTLDLHGNRDILHTLATHVYNQALRELCIYRFHIKIYQLVERPHFSHDMD